MHKAFVKCERLEISWRYQNNIRSIEYWKEKYFCNKKEKNRYSYSFGLRSYEDYWIDAIRSHGVINEKYLSGECIIWEGEVNQERLRIGDYLFIPTLKEYFKIEKVETTPDGEITYYIDYKKLFTENGEHSRLESVEEWIKDEYPSVNMYEDLKLHKEDIDVYIKEFEDRKNDDKYYSDLEKEEGSYTIVKNLSYEKEINSDDLNLEKILIICGISAVVIIGIMFMIGLS